MTNTEFIPASVPPADRMLGIFASLRAVRRNVLSILPPIAYSQPIVTGKTGPARWHMVQGPEGMRRIFLDNAANYPKSEVMIRMLRPAAGQSIFIAEGADWLWQRHAIAPVFSARNVASLAPVMTETANRAADRLASSESPVGMVSQMLNATFDVICDVALSGRDHFDAAVYGAAITRYMQTVGRASLFDFLRLPPWFPRPAELVGMAPVRTMQRMVTAAIEERRYSGPRPNSDLLDFMLAAEDAETGRKMTQRNLVHNMQFFIVAGHETTALALSWALYLLANYPETQDAAAAEAMAVRNGGSVGAEEVAQMPLVDAILHEALRLYPPVSFLARDTLQADTIYDREIRAGDTIFVNIYGLHRHQLYWKDPDLFDPGRFLPPQNSTRDRYVYIPFGAGPRICAGASFAMMQGAIILATLLTHFRFAPGGAEPHPVMHMSLRPEPEVLLKVTPR